MDDFTLWYTTPAVNWNQGLPLGNGRMGAVVMAAPSREVWSMSEVTYWSGQADPEPALAGGKRALEEMRRQFYSGNYDEGDRLAKRYLQPDKQNFGTNLGLCKVVIQFAEQGPDRTLEGSFRRELDLNLALVKVAWRNKDTTVYREVFASHADDLVVSRVWSDRSGGVSFSLSLEGETGSFRSTTMDDCTLKFESQATENVHSNGSCGVSAEGYVKIVVAGGTVTGRDGRLTVHGADEASIYFAVSTNYRKTGPEWRQESRVILDKALGKGYPLLRAHHMKDYAEQYNKVDIQLGTVSKSNLTTDQRIRSLAGGGDDDPQLFALFLQYGRYLTIAGSRANSPLPLHLQGIWNDGEACRMGWSCDYHLDINTQMNYYPAEITNLGDSHLPLMRYVEDLAVAGKSTARNLYGSEGWVAHVFSNVWGFTLPGWDTSWGLNVTGGLWLATHLMEHYEYSQDRAFLESTAYPVLKEAAAFYLDYMDIHPEYGWLVTGPSNSPENHFYPGTAGGAVHQLSMGTTLDQILVRELFEFCLNSIELLERDQDFGEQLREAVNMLPPLQIGKKGQLQEWLEDYEEAQPEHRHLSHLFALYPGHQITPERTPELSAAARVTMQSRMLQEELEDVEFTAALFGLGFARLHDGEMAYKHVSHLISGLCFDNLFTYSKSGIAGAETNIFVIDGNFGGTAVIAEMLLQSYEGEIHLLPALPQAWSKGKVTGLRAKGNAEVDAVWEDGELTSATIRTFTSGTYTVCRGERRTTFRAEAGVSYTFNRELDLIDQ